MKYRDILGLPKKKAKKVVTPKPTAPPVTELLKEEFGNTINEGPAYEYAANLKAIEKSYKTFKTEIFKFASLLEKKGLKKESRIFEKTFSKKVGDWYRFFEGQVRKLM